MTQFLDFKMAILILDVYVLIILSIHEIIRSIFPERVGL